MLRKPTITLTLALMAAAALPAAHAGSSWSKRSGDLQNTGNAGFDPQLSLFTTLSDLKALYTIPTDGFVNGTPVVTDDGLLITGDWSGYVYVVDVNAPTHPVVVKMKTASGGHANTPGNAVKNITNEFGPYVGVQSSPTLATVTVSTGEERRVYVSANSPSKTMYCLNLDAIAAVRTTAVDDPGDSFLCSGTDSNAAPIWPRSLAPDGNGTMNGSPMFAEDQWIDLNHDHVQDPGEVRDVLYTPSTGLDCANGQFYAIDALTGELLWSFDPVPEGDGGTIWTTPAMNEDRSLVYLTTGDCVGQPQAGAKAESLIALDAHDGHVVWFHQRRLADTADLDIGNGPVVADVEEGASALLEPACHVVVSSDKDGCMYGFAQQADIAEVGELGFDPLRVGQQRLLWRKCFVPGSLNGGFNASNPAFDGRYVVQQTSGYPDGHVGADDCNVFAVNACTGETQWCSSSIGNGRADAAIASGYLFQIGGTFKGGLCSDGLALGSSLPPGTCSALKTASDSVTAETGRYPNGVTEYPYEIVRELNVVQMYSDLYPFPVQEATVQLPAQTTLGGGGPAIVKGRIYIPTVAGIVVVGIDPGSNASLPIHRGKDIFAGPYLEPMAPGGVPATVPPVDKDHPPYPLLLDTTIQRVGAYRN